MFWILLLLAILATTFVCFRQARRPSGIAKQFPPKTDQEINLAYAGSASCRDCHEEDYNAWASSHHGLAERLPDATVDEQAFVPALTFQHGTQESSLRKSDGRYEIATDGLNATQEVFQIERIIGASPLRQMLVPFPGGRLQATEAAFDPRAKEWFNVNGNEGRRPGEWGHWTGRGMNWNSMCAACHNTRLRKNYDATSDAYRTVMAERSVGCESCHGPMKAHNDWQRANKGKPLKDPTISKFSRDQIFDTCAACHSRRSEIAGDVKPGDSYFDHYLLSTVDASDLFYPDGQVRAEDYEVSAFLGSKMYHSGVRCMDCHDVHTAKVRLPGNMMCLSCHAMGQTNAPVINPVTHSHHKVFGFDTNGVMLHFDLSSYKPGEIKETGGECVNCHMPQTVYMQRHRRHDHGFTIPDPLLTKQFGIPNACNRCHKDESTDWSLKYVDAWYGEKMNRPTRQRAQMIARARNGDGAVRDDLLKAFQSDPQDYWRAVAATLLERWVDQAPVANALCKKLSDSNALVRQSVVQTLSGFGDSLPPNVRAALEGRLGDPSRNVRVMAALTLAPTLNLNSPAGLDLVRMLDFNADQPTGQMQQGGFLLARGDATNALLHFNTAERWDPYSPDIRREVAVLLSRMGRSDDAVKELQAAVRFAPKEARFHFELALAWNEIGEAAKALKELEEAVRLDPRDAGAQYNLGLARNAGGDMSGAIQSLLAAEAADPDDPRIPYARATIQARAGQFAEARRAVRRALELNPQFTEATTLLRQIEGK